jgi:antitoxin HicB
MYLSWYTGLMNKKHIGSTLESLFEEKGELEKFTIATQRKLLAYDLEQAMKKQKVTRTQMARRMKTTRAVVYRMLDCKSGITLDTVGRAAAALGMDFQIHLVPRAPKK